MTSNEIRNSFLDFFKSKEHRIVPSAPVIPHGDPTLLFTNAGMNQFKDVFLGIGKRDYSRAADTQKCIRVSGKHNDLEEVGVDTYHHTFFEMLGNWSFGDYYKKEAIAWAWELLTEIWGLEKKRLHATVYRTDDEAYEIWKNYLPEERIHRFDEKDNFWEMGESGPCGPCSEIHFDRTADYSGGKLVNAGVPEVIEIWNLVFIQYNRRADGSLEDLTAKHVDTGMGFERIVAVLQGKNSNYDTDVFSPLINEIEKLSNKKYSTELNNPDGIAMRVIADHVRTLSFSIADGALPGNEGRGYVLRRILRRGSRFARNLGFNEPIMFKLVSVLADSMSEVFPELMKNKDTIQRVIKAEEESFLQTLDRGIEKFEQFIKKPITVETKTIQGEDAFLLYDTFGFPLDLTELMAREQGYEVDVEGYSRKMQEQKQRSRDSRKIHSQEVELPLTEFKTEFTGYSEIENEAEVLFVQDNQVILDKTPFYVESGGQVSDTGWIVLAGEKYEVNDVRKSGDAIVHICDRNVEPLIGHKALAKIDIERRRDIMRNHSATHLLHEALNQVLGSHIKQAGSLVAPDYLRFDFNHFEKVTPEELSQIEKIVNKKIFEQIQVETNIMALEEARKNPKIKMFFGDKYGDVVRAVTMDKKYSTELCGGTHVSNTGEIGFFKIISESSIAAGVRRIEAITGRRLEDYIQQLQKKIEEEKQRNDELLDKIRQLEKEISGNKLNDIKSSIEDWIKGAKLVNSIRYIARKIEADSIDELRTIGENLRNAFGTHGIGLITSVQNDKVQLVVVVTDDLKTKYPAGKIVAQVSKFLGGSGGGKPHLATGGGKDVEKLDELLKNFGTDSFTVLPVVHN
ncbi:alanine--tRNA ligase [Bacteroidetes/Chlorobi group bacterium ChocPot_Mid]|nr:MAG: alanine--tRNA ligase [Bacteroidetes/Chlorobi group bacterium ChocPot_Mid]